MLLTENTKIYLEIVDHENRTRDLLPKPVTKDSDSLKGFGRYGVTRVEPLDYECIRIFLDAGVKND